MRERTITSLLPLVLRATEGRGVIVTPRGRGVLESERELQELDLDLDDEDNTVFRCWRDRRVVSSMTSGTHILSRNFDVLAKADNYGYMQGKELCRQDSRSH